MFTTFVNPRLPRIRDLEDRDVFTTFVDPRLPRIRDLEARFVPPIANADAWFANHGRDLEARVLPIPAIVAGLMGVAAGAPLIPLFQKPKREPEPQTWADLATPFDAPPAKREPSPQLPTPPKLFRFLP